MSRLSLMVLVGNKLGTLGIQNQARSVKVISNVFDSGVVFTSTHISQDLRESKPPTQVRFDTDSFRIKIDNCCTRSITPSVDDFVGPLTTVQGQGVKGFGGESTPIKHIGTVRWLIEDDDGVAREILIPNTYHVPSAPARLLSPQHWAQEFADNVPDPNGTGCGTYQTSVVLHWSQQKYKRTINLDPSKQNVATLWSSSGFARYNAAYCSTIDQPIAYDATATPNVIEDYDDSMEVEEPAEMYEPADTNADFPLNPSPSLRQSGLVTDFDLNMKATDSDDGRPVMIEDDSEDYGLSASALMLRWHHRLSHISMKRIQLLAERGQLPKQLAKCRVPLCTSCVYGKMSRRKWRSKTPINSGKVVTITAPGQCVSVDQLESTVLGFFGQLKGKLTKARYRAATVFVDHFSDFTYVHLQESTSAAQTIEAKVAFESYCRSNGVKVLHYHGDNGRFADNSWRKDCITQGQRLTFCGVSAHHQNGRAEKKIRDSKDLARTALLHASTRWPDAVNVHLWPYALRNAVDSLNKTSRIQTKLSPMEMFSGSSVLPNLSQDHVFGAPAFALDGDLQNRKKIDAWASRARMAVYLGQSPQHAQSVGLLLSLKTGLVSPQFHVKYDDLFEATRDKFHKLVPKSVWQSLAGFVDSSGSEPSKDSKNKGVTIIIPPPDEPTEVAPPDIPPTENIQQDNVPLIQPEIPVELVPPRSVAGTHVPRTVTRAGRVSRPPQRFDDYVVNDEALSAEVCYQICDTQVEHRDPISYAVSSDPDVMHLRQAMKQPDKAQFVAAMVNEVNAHVKNKNWVLILRSSVPSGHKVLPAVWAMRRKRRIDTREVYKWKARLNIHGGKQTYGLNYWETYAPVATWPSIRLIVNIATYLKWFIRQLDFVLAFPQAPCETDLFMELPFGFTCQGDRKLYVLKLVNNLYGQKQAGRVWYKYLSNGLCDKLKFKQSAIDPCVFWRGSVILVIYTDDTIVIGEDLAQIEKAIDDISKTFVITTAPTVTDFLGVKIQHDSTDGTYTMKQPHLIDSILNDLFLTDSSKTRVTPALSTTILQQYLESPSHHEDWHYRSVVGKLNYLEKCTRPDIAYAVHQCARFAHDPKVEHSAAVKCIGHYLLATRDKGIICRPNGASFDCYADADFSGQWERNIAELDASTARSRTGYIIFHNGCPIVWASKLQTEIALSSTESEYISLSQSLREVIPMIRLATELVESDFVLGNDPPRIHCKAFEDNSGALEMARTPKMRPRTKHLNIKYHHFREAVDDGTVSIHSIDTKDQLADLLTKPLPPEAFIRLRFRIMGW